MPSGVKPRTMSAAGCQVRRRGGPPADRNQIHVGVSLVLGAEGDEAPVRREDRIGDGVQVAGQPADVPAVQVGNPEIVGVDEGDVPGAHGGLAQQPRVLDVRLGQHRLRRQAKRSRRKQGQQAKRRMSNLLA